MYSLDEIKNVLSGDYGFHQAKAIDEVKTILENGEMTDNSDVPFVLEIGNLDIEITIKWNEDDTAYLEYFCCIRKDGEWESYNNADTEVNLDVPDLESEMFRVLNEYADKHKLSFFSQNQESEDNVSDEKEDDLER